MKIVALINKLSLVFIKQMNNFHENEKEISDFV